MREWLAEKRKEANMTTYEVAAAAGIGQSYYSAIETGERGKPLNAYVAKKIANVLNFDWTKFYEEAE